MDQVSMSQEEVDFLSGKKAKKVDDELAEGKAALEGVLGSPLPALPEPSEQVNGAGTAAETEASGQEEAAAEEEDDVWMDILGSGALRKKVLREGDGDKPEHGSRVTVRYHTFLMVGDNAQVAGPMEETITCGDCDIVQAFDMVLLLMQEGELARVESVPRFAYKDQIKTIKREGMDDAVIPADSKVCFELALLKIHPKPEHGSVSLEWILEECSLKKQRGNELFAAGDYGQAIWLYKKALDWLDNDDPAKQVAEATPEVREMQVSTWNNLAQAFIKIQQWKDALGACDRALRVDPDNVKALYRASKVYTARQDFDNSIRLLTRANKADPSNKAVSSDLQLLRSRRAAQQAREKAMYRRMVSGESATSSSSSPSSSSTAGQPAEGGDGKTTTGTTADSSTSSSFGSKLTTATLFTGGAVIAALAVGAALFFSR